MKNLNLGNLGLGNILGGGAQATTNGQTITAEPGEAVTMTQQTNGNKIIQRNTKGGSNISVQGKGACACANGVCEGDCSDMEPIDLENFDPLEWVEQHT